MTTGTGYCMRAINRPSGDALMLPVLDMVGSYRKVDDVTRAILLTLW